MTNGKTYTCTVKATNAVGTGPASAGVGRRRCRHGAGGARLTTVAPGNAQVTVTFTAPADGGSAITSYTACCVSSNGGTTGSAAGAGSPLVVGTLTNGKSYTCTVTATNANGAGPASPASAAVVPSTTPSAPAQPTVSRGTRKYSDVHRAE